MCQTELERRAYLCGMKAISAFGGSAGADNSQRDFGPPTLTSDAGPLLQSWLRAHATNYTVMAVGGNRCMNGARFVLVHWTLLRCQCGRSEAFPILAMRGIRNKLAGIF